MQETERLITETLEQVKAGYSYCKENDADVTEGLMTARENLQTLREHLAELAAEQTALHEKIKSLEASLELSPTLRSI